MKLFTLFYLKIFLPQSPLYIKVNMAATQSWFDRNSLCIVFMTMQMCGTIYNISYMKIK